jgi:hypothetical protein
MQAACNRTKGAHPFDFDVSGMEAQVHTSCNRRAGCYVQETAPPLAPLPCLLDCTTVNTARNGPAVMAVAGGRKQRSRHQPSSRPLLGQRENPLPRREDSAPVFRSSNGSRTRNGCPANHSSRRINSAAGQASPLAGEAGDASLLP